MNEKDLIGELCRRAGVPEASAEALLEALRAMARDGLVNENVLRSSEAAERPDPCLPVPEGKGTGVSGGTGVRAADELIACARNHPLGLEFLRGGYLGSVAAVFGANAFTVEEARAKLHPERTNENSKEVKA
jgi:hypothetical protein